MRSSVFTARVRRSSPLTLVTRTVMPAPGVGLRGRSRAFRTVHASPATCHDSSRPCLPPKVRSRRTVSEDGWPLVQSWCSPPTVLLPYTFFNGMSNLLFGPFGRSAGKRIDDAVSHGSILCWVTRQGYKTLASERARVAPAQSWREPSRSSL